MSVVVAIKQGNKIYMGADSQVTRGGTRLSLSNPNNYKIWKVKGVENCLMASVGDLRDACVIRIMNGLVREIDALKGEVDFEYVVGRIVPLIKEELSDYGYIKKDGVFEGFESSYLFAFEDKLFYINRDASVIEIDDCIAIGSGSNEAIGSLITSSKEEDSEQRIVKAIKSSATHDIYVDYPIILVNTETTEFKVLTEDKE